jgi:tetratricopeptide (TPR) repeat protein
MREGRPAARTSGAPTMDALTERDLFAAVNARKIGRDDLVRTHCANLLKEGDGAESSAFLDACDMVVRGFAGGRTGPGGGAWRSPYAEWLERVLFPDRRDIKELALARAEYLLGNLAGAGDHAEACLASAARPYPISRAWLLKGRIRLREGDLAGALPCFSEVLRWAGPEDHAGAEALFLAGYAYLMDGDLARADEAFGSLEARYPAGRFSAKAAALRAGIEQSMGMIVPETLPLAVESGGS